MGNYRVCLAFICPLCYNSTVKKEKLVTNEILIF